MTGRRRLLAAAIVSSVVLGACATSRTVHPIEGRWNIVEATRAGQPMPLTAFGSSLLTLDAGTYEFQQDRGDYVVLPGTSPAALDLHGRVGPNAGRTTLAIFALDGDSLLICYGIGATQRPRTLTSTLDNGLLLIRYRRA